MKFISEILSTQFLGRIGENEIRAGVKFEPGLNLRRGEKFENFSYCCGDCPGEEKCIMKIPMLGTVPLKSQIVVDTELSASFDHISNSITPNNHCFITEFFR